MFKLDRGKVATARGFCIMLLLTLSISAFGQTRFVEAAQEPVGSRSIEKVKDEIARLILSENIKDRAWGAYLIGIYGLSEFSSALIELLIRSSDTSSSQAESRETGFLHRIALDSLIQLHATVPGEKLLPFYQKFPDEMIILLAQSPAENTASLLLLLEEVTRGIGWVAVCNLLTEVKAPGFAALLLKDVRIEVYDTADGATIIPDTITRTSINEVTLTGSNLPGTFDFRILISEV